MSTSAPLTSDPDSPPDDWAGDHVRMLRELAELGMALARAVAGQAMAQAQAGEAADAAAQAGPDPSLAFTRIARTVRLTLALEARVREGRAAQRVAEAGAIDAAGAAAAADRVQARIRTLIDEASRASRESVVRHVVEQILETERPESDGLDDLLGDIAERLDDDNAGYGVRPIGAVVAHICHDLGVRPDWSRWAREPWAVQEARIGAAGSPYAMAASPPPLNGGGGAARSAVTEGARRPIERPLSQPPESG